MSREIKFRRAYFNYKDDSFAGFSYWGPEYNSDGEPRGFIGPASWQGAIGKFDQQFTGLKDKNGKDIYEGDTLKFFDRVVANVIYKDFGGWSFEWIDVTYKRIRHNPEPFFRNINLFEVAGNIYENPDILSKSLTLEKV